ncbi:MAG: AAA family ATPase [Bacteriovorax sp.]|jgi:flagellar biosynthesis protein FlhG|nr:AAA family ATPase [Bacteriovorax sp.]
MLSLKKSNPSDWLVSQNKYQSKKTGLKAKTISVTAGKGGVGKTSVAVKMARLMASSGYKVLLLDCDTNLSNTVVKLGLPINNYFYELISAQRDFDDCLHKDGNLHLLSGCNGSIDLFNKNLEVDRIIIDILVNHERDYDYIILDCPAGITKETLTLNAYSDYRFVVVTPDKSSVTDSYSLIKILNKEFGVNDNHLLINKVSSEPQYQRMVKTLSETVETFLKCRLHILGGIKNEEIPVDQFDSVLLEQENSSLHKNFVKIVKKFTDEIEGAALGRDFDLSSKNSQSLEHDVRTQF